MSERYGELFRYAKTRPCLLADRGKCDGPVTGHHVRTVGSGAFDHDNVVPLCRGHHREVHTLGTRTFQSRYGLDLALHARSLTDLHEGLAF